MAAERAVIMVVEVNFELGHFMPNLAGGSFSLRKFSQVTTGTWEVGILGEGGCIF